MGRKSNAQLAAERALQETAANLVLNTEFSGDSEAVDDADEIRALSELDSSGDVRWNVFRTMPAATAGWVGVFSTSELSLERIAQEFGVGRYRVKGSRPNGTIAGQRTVSIAAVPKNLIAPPAEVAKAPTGGIQDYISLMEAKDKERSANMLQWAAIIGPIATAMLPAMFGNKGPTLQDLTATLVNMKQLNGGSESQLSKIEELAKLVEVVQGIGGDGGKGSGWADIVRDGIKTVGDVLPALASRIPGFMPPQSAPPHLAAPAPVVITQGSAPATRPSPQPTPPKDTPMLQLLGWLKEQCAGLAHQASLNKDPNLYADVVLDNLPEVDPTMLRNMLGAPDWWATLCQFSPNVQPYPQWFAECREALVKGLDEMISAAAPPKMPHDTDSTDE
jgi:hypothetical protein